jgi:hypothetical protein
MADDLGTTAVRRALVLNRQDEHPEGAESIYRCAAQLRHLLPADARKHLAAVFEWAREGIRQQVQINSTPELEALRAACTYACDVLLAEAEEGKPPP